MSEEIPAPAPAPAPIPLVEQLFEAAVKTNLLLVGRETVRRSKSILHFVLITTDIIDNHREEVLTELRHYPVVQHYSAADFERLFKVKGAKTVGFAKSELAKSIYAELKSFRINQPVNAAKKPDAPASPPGTPTA